MDLGSNDIESENSKTAQINRPRSARDKVALEKDRPDNHYLAQGEQLPYSTIGERDPEHSVNARKNYPPRAC